MQPYTAAWGDGCFEQETVSNASAMSLLDGTSTPPGCRLSRLAL